MVRKTLQWIATILLLAGLGGGSYAYWFFTHSDEMLREEVTRALCKKFPSVEFTIRRARFDWSRRVHAYDVVFGPRGAPQPVGRCAEIVFTLDGQALLDEQKIDLRSIRVVKPDLQVVRRNDGHWSVQDLLPIAESDDPLPDITFEDFQIVVHVNPSRGEPLAFHLREADVHLVPSARRAYSLEANLKVPALGEVRLDGSFDIEKQVWKLGGSTGANADLGELYAKFSQVCPERARRIAEVHCPLGAFQTADASGSSATGPMGLRGQGKIQVEVRRTDAGAPLQYKVLLEPGDAELEHSAFPFPLHELSGQIYFDQRQLVLRGVKARAGEAWLSADGRVDLPVPRSSNRIHLVVQGLPIDRRLYALLPPPAKGLWDCVHPAGIIDAHGALVCGEAGKWEPVDWTLTHQHGSVLHRDFPYPVTEITGQSIQKGRTIAIRLSGRMGDRPVTLEGTVQNPGPEADAVYQVEVGGLPINGELLKAAAAHPELLHTVEALRLHGLVDARCWFHRPKGIDRKIEWMVAARVSEGSLEYQHFPYRIENLEGLVNFDSAHGEWKFQRLSGRHGPAELTGEGVFVKTSHDDPGELMLTVHAEDAPIENDLQQAFPRPTQKLWNLIRPTGKLRTDVVLKWVPGTPPRISVPEARVTDGSLELSSFPYPIDHVSARFTYGYDESLRQQRLAIQSFTGHHDRTTLQLAPPEDKFESFVLFPSDEDPDGEWRVRLERLIVDDLNPDPTFCHALPIGLRKSINALNPRGRVSLKGMIELRGNRHPEVPMTAAWDFETTATGATITTGIELKNVHGRAITYGDWDGNRVRMRGRVNLRSMTAWNHQFTDIRGPFELIDQKLTVGSERAFRPIPAGAQEKPIPSEERLTAKAVGGTFFLDAKATLDSEKTRYNVKASMHNASLDNYARTYMRRAGSLHGVMNGWVDLEGSSPDPKDVSGHGQLLINPAALYELPVFLQIFKEFRLSQPDKTAFNYAMTTFSIARRQVEFTKIDLIGDPLSLRGRGKALFDGRLKLEFYSRPSSAWQIPLVKEVVNQFGQGWVGVSVRGTVQDPITQYRAAPQIDDALKQFLNAFNPRPGTLPPLTPQPWMYPFPMMQAPPRTQAASAGR